MKNILTMMFIALICLFTSVSADDSVYIRKCYYENGLLMPNLKEVRGDTAFVDLEYFENSIIPVN